MAGKRTGGHFGNECKKCGAKRIDQQIGSEPTPDEFVATMVDVFREVRRVLRDDGTVWLNLGDTYAASGYSENRSWEQSEVTHASNYSRAFRDKMENNTGKNIKVKTGMAAGNLVGIPWRVALALQADGWILRQDIIWHKVAPMPESVSDRCTKAHEYIFLLCKRKPYYYDAEAIKEVTVTAPHKPGWAKSNRDRQDAQPDNEANHREWGGQNRNKRSVWTVSSQGYEGSHFACFPQKLIEPCILAGVPEKCCSQCGAPHLRLTEKTQLTRERPNDYVKRTGEEGTGNSCANSVAGVNTKTIGWQPQCDCNASVVGGTVLDPFVGSGTTVVVALQNNRKGIGIDLSQTYLLDNAIPRIEGACHDMPELAKRLGKQAKVLTGGTLLKR